MKRTGLWAGLMAFLMLGWCNEAQADYNIMDFVILVTDQVEIKGQAGIVPLGGKPLYNSYVGAGESVWLGGKLRVKAIGDGGCPNNDVKIIGKNVKIDKWASVCSVDWDQAGGGSYTFVSYGNKPPEMVNPVMDRLPQWTGLGGPLALYCSDHRSASTDADVDIIVPKNTSQVIMPGVYRDLIVGPFSQVYFATGGGGETPFDCPCRQPAVYQFRRIIVKGHTTRNKIYMPNAVEIRVRDFVVLPEFTGFNAMTDPKDPMSCGQCVTLWVWGEDGYYFEDGAAQNTGLRSLYPDLGDPTEFLPSAFSYAGDGQFNACLVFVPNGTMTVRGHEAFKTQWFGKSFQQYGGLSITLAHPGIKCWCCNPHPDCIPPCVFAVEEQSDGTVIVRGSRLEIIECLKFVNLHNNLKALDQMSLCGTGDCDYPIATGISPIGIDMFGNEYFQTLFPPSCGPGEYLFGIASPSASGGSVTFFAEDRLKLVVP